MQAYYPGNAYIDWIGVSIYGPLNANDPDKYSFSDIFDSIYADFSGISGNKSLAIFEFGVGEF